ncbi:MAG: hypothetical protein ACRYFX_08920 [Janthinobacterium lividum]
MSIVLPQNLANYFIGREWYLKSENDTFLKFAPPASANLPSEFELMIPKSVESSQYERFIRNTIEILCQVGNADYLNESDLQRILQGDAALLALRVCDPDTRDGSINFLNYGKQLEKIKELIKEAVGFSLTNQQYFVNTPKVVAENYLGNCRGLQTAVGSFVTKVKMPYGDVMEFAIDRLDTTDVVNRIGNTYDFVLKDVVNTPVDRIDASYMNQHQSVFSIQVVDKIQQLYSQSNINNADLSLSTIYSDNTYSVRNFLKTVKHLRAFTQKARKVLMSSTPLDARGKVVRLISKNPEAANGHKILVRSEINNSAVSVDVTLTRDHYRQAIQAHEFNRTVHITGFARETNYGFQVENVETFVLE